MSGVEVRYVSTCDCNLTSSATGSKCATCRMSITLTVVISNEDLAFSRYVPSRYFVDTPPIQLVSRKEVYISSRRAHDLRCVQRRESLSLCERVRAERRHRGG